MKLFKAYKITFLAIFSLFFLSSCSKEDVSDNSQNSLVNVKLKGTESLLSKVNIEVLEVQFRVLEDETAPNAWVSLNTINTGIHDITNLTQDEVVPLVDYEEIPSGYIYDIKIVLGNENMVIANGVEQVLEMSSEFQDASNVIGKQLDANMLYEFIVEFEIDKSVSFSSDGSANLKPKTNTLMRRFNLY